MTFEVLPRHTSLFMMREAVEAGRSRLRKTLIVSLVLHLGVLAVIMGARLFKHVERPMSAVEVSLVTMPPTETKPDRPVEKVEKVEKAVPHPAPKPVQTAPIPVPPKTMPPTPMSKPAPPPPPAPRPAPAPMMPTPTLSAPQPIPQAARVPAATPTPKRADVLRDVMKEVELPPDAPKYGDLAPVRPAEAKRAAQPRPERSPERSEVDAMLKKLQVPDMAQAPQAATPDIPKPIPVPPKRTSLAEDMTEVDRELQNLKQLHAPPPVKTTEPVREVKPMFREPQPTASAPLVTASVTRTKPETKLRVAGVAGSNQYLARVQARISSFWTAPPVDISGKALTVMVRFRLERNGQVSGVTIEQSSGNDYYDMAAQRAVQSAIPLPPFPSDLTESYFDAHFSFAVGEAAG